MIVYLDSSRGISAGLVLGALLDAGADIALVRRILGTVTLPRIALMRASERVGTMTGTVASIAIAPVRRDTLFLDVIRTLENGRAPLAVRTWGGGMLTRLLEAEAMVHGLPLDAVPLADPVAVAELLAVSAALAALQIVRVYAAPIGRTEDSVSHSVLMQPKGHPQSSVLLEEAEWPVGSGAFVTPGGAAILAALAEPGVPSVRLSAVGYGIVPDAPYPLCCWLGTPYHAGKMPTVSGTRAGAVAHAHPHADGDDH
ncbi:MAG: nickel insertion protein [Thermomicrobiales bacterium]